MLKKVIFKKKLMKSFLKLSYFQHLKKPSLEKMPAKKFHNLKKKIPK